MFFADASKQVFEERFRSYLSFWWILASMGCRCQRRFFAIAKNLLDLFLRGRMMAAVKPLIPERSP